MKKLYFSILLVLVTFFPARSQENILWEETFDDNRRSWSVSSGQDLKNVLENGQYIQTQMKENTAWYQSKSAFIDPNKDYSIEAEMTQLSGLDNNGYGIVWGVMDGNNFNGFILTSNGNFKIYEVRGGTWTEHKPWTPTTLVKPMNQKNVISIVKKGNTSRYLLNGEEVHSGAPISLPGMNIGIISYTALTFATDRITVRQDNKINLLAEVPAGITKENLGPNVNNSFEQICPVIAPDGKTLFWSNRFHPENTDSIRDPDEIWYSTFEKGQWTKSKNIGQPLNTKAPNWVVSVTPDNNSMIVANSYSNPVPAKAGALSITYRTATGWSQPTDILIENLASTSDYWNFFLSNDRRTLLMTMKRADTYGYNDVYVSFMQDNGIFTQPKNLGPTINSFADEWTPFLASDGTTLYYTSSGKPNYGNGDIFMAKRLDSTWTNWSEPLNLGPEINTPEGDAGFTLTASGEYGYLTSAANSLGSADIFRVKLPNALKPQPVVIIYGKVLNSKTNQPLAADITYRNLASDKLIGLANSNPTDGSYKIVLTAGQVYSFLGEKENFYPISENFDVQKLTEYKEIEKNLYLAPIEVGSVIRMNNLFFDFGKSDLRPESFPELDRAVEFLNKYPSIAIEVGGHTDNVGSDKDNKKLSQDRAESVENYLLQKNITAERLQSTGYGKTKPMVKNDTDENRQTNRRVEFIILKK